MKDILIDEIRKDLNRLRLGDILTHLEPILEQAEQQQQGYLEFLSALTHKQVEGITSRSLERRLKKAKLSSKMTFDNFNWNFQEELNVPYIKDLAHLNFVEKGSSLLILGKNGTGKTHLANAFGVRACEVGYKVSFNTLQSILKALYASLADDSTESLIAEMTRHNLLILDGAGFIRTQAEYPALLFELIHACQGLSVIITSHVSFLEWGELLGSPSITHAIVDRLMDKACIINIAHGRSYRSEGPHAPKTS